MIRRGRAEGWLRLPMSTLRTWSALNDIQSHGVKIAPYPGHEERGYTVIIEAHLKDTEDYPLVTVPRAMVLSLEFVHNHAKYDRDLKDILVAIDEFGRTARGAILTFLLMQAFIAFPKTSDKRGVSSPFSEYIKFLPEELLPTFWSESERQLLTGTTLKPALEAKMKSLYREFDYLRTRTANIPWCRDLWWDEIEGVIDYDDWKQCDAMYRSRALEFPGIGDSMVPVIDMANHASGEGTRALYETDNNGDALLLPIDRTNLNVGDEATITYGEGKGACEMLFSYGFIEDSTTSAREMFLDLEIPDDDPLKRAKNIVSTAAPGFRLHDDGGSTSWESDYIWLICVNEEDGLRFQIAQSNDGDQELRISWKDEELDDIALLKSKLMIDDDMWAIFQLRAVSIIHARIVSQLELLSQTDHETNAAGHGRDVAIRSKPLHQALKLRSLERVLLEKACEDLQGQKGHLLQCDAVLRYLETTEPQGDAVEKSQEDFS